jgi:hypothetical protein
MTNERLGGWHAAERAAAGAEAGRAQVGVHRCGQRLQPADDVGMGLGDAGGLADVIV